MLDEQFLKRLETLRLKMRHPAMGSMGGLRRSKALGTSVEFSDFREYAAGDDLRRVDWNAYARFDKLFVKLFMEEQEAKIHLLLDASASMAFGEPSKWETAVKLAETLAYLALCGGDAVTVTALKGESAASTRPLSGRQGYIEVSQFLNGIVPAGTTHLNTAVRKAAILPGRGVSVLLSDFFSPDGYKLGLQSLQYRKQEVAALQILSRQERSPELEDAVQLLDAETGERMEIMANYDVLKAYHETLEDFLNTLKRFCHQNAMAYTTFQPEEDVERMMLRELSRIGLLA